ncbi:aminotransferase class III-fold pyridoxal phosphate-dependent enzyme [Nocardia vulneris]|uniref:aminotransferase class III-fold pyridoxal phosphate-dependent enzyme n=1 Tax=Nocardia vulneris TaxID=1141657 RepID=UPI0030CDABF5
MTAPTPAAGRRPGTGFVVGIAETVRLAWWTSILAAEYLLVPRNRTDDVRKTAMLRRYLLRMGPLYIKAGQILGTQTGWFSPDAADNFREFFSGLPPMSRRKLRKKVREGFGVAVEEIFADFDWAPLAVGSVAQVHRATLRDGRAVAVKIVKAGVAERIRASSTVIGILLAIGHRIIPQVRSLDGPAHFGELRPALIGQCDMLGEAQRQQAVAHNFRTHPYLTIPTVYEEHCRAEILVMEFVDAVSGEEVERVQASHPDLARRLQDVFYTMAFFHGCFHVDPHPGNMMFTHEGGIIALDFGLVGHLSEDDKWNLASFFYACVRKEWSVASDRFTRAFVAQPGRLGPARDEYEAKLAVILRKHFETESYKWSTVGFFDEGTRLLRSYGARVTTSFSLLALAFLTGEGYICRIDPEIDIWRNGRKFTDRFSPYMSDELKEDFENRLGRRIPLSMQVKNDQQRPLIAPSHLDRFALPSAFPLIVAEAEGSRIVDIDGNSYIDLSSGYGPHILGYAPKCAVAAISEAAASGAVNSLGNRPELELAELIAEAFGPDAKVVLANSGTEAVQVALRLGRAYTGRQRVAKFEGHYHGFSDQGMVSSWFRYSGDRTAPTAIANSAGVHQVVVEDTMVLQYGDRSSLRVLAEQSADVAAVIIEPMPSATVTYDAEFLRELREVCTAHGIVLIFDEVVTGFRACYGGIQHLVEVRPDLTCLGKIIGGGLPCGAVVGRTEVVNVARTSEDPFLDVDSRAFVGGTMSGNSITAAAGVAVLRELSGAPEIYQRLEDRTQQLYELMRASVEELGVPCGIKAKHSIFSIAFDYAKGPLIRDRLSGADIKASLALAYYMRGRGVYLPELHTILLNAAHSEDDVRDIAEAFDSSIREMSTHGFFAA